MKLLFISNIAASKIGSFSIASIRAAKELGLEFYIAANFKNSSYEQILKDENEYQIKICNIDFERNPLHPKNFKALRQLIELIRKEKIDYIHCNTPTGGIYGRLAGRLCKVKKIIYQVHGFHFYDGAPIINWLIYYPIEKIFAKLTDAIITINKEDYKRAKKFQLRHQGKVYYVPGVGLDLSKYVLNPTWKTVKRKELNIPMNDIMLISVGELNKNKNHNVVLDALGDIQSSHLHYLICGIGDQEYVLKEQARNLKIENNVHFLGYRSDIPQLLQASDIFIMPSLREGLSRSLMEAMAMGLPCIVSKIRGNTDLLEDKTGGFWVPAKDSRKIAKSLKILCDDITIRKQMGERNRNRIQDFRIEKVQYNLKTIYEKEML